MSFLSEIPLELSRLFTYAPLTPFAFGLALRYPLQRENWLRRSLVLLAGGIAFMVAHVILRGLTYPVWDWGTRGFVSAVWDSQTHGIRIRPELFLRLFYINSIEDITGALSAYCYSCTRRVLLPEIPQTANYALLNWRGK